MSVDNQLKWECRRLQHELNAMVVRVNELQNELHVRKIQLNVLHEELKQQKRKGDGQQRRKGQVASRALHASKK